MISKDKTYRTRDGREVRIYATDGHEIYPIHGAIMDKGWCPHHWMPDGRGAVERFDLIEVKPRIQRTVYLHIYRDTTFASDTRIQRCMGNPLSIVKVDINCEEGEGL